ncbi:hypothetical protein PISMIDRAFT_121710, partial [Pisolithus microcarpus 441]
VQTTEMTTAAVFKILNRSFNVFTTYWAAHAESVGALLVQPGQVVTPRDNLHHNPLQMLPATLLLWEDVPPSSPFHTTGSFAIHFSIQSRTNEPWNELANLLLFLGGLASV